VYIVFQPFYHGHDDSLQLPHQSIDRNGRRYANWPSKLDSLGDAKTVATLWAELSQRYQRTPEQRRAVPTGPDCLGDAVNADGTGPCTRTRSRSRSPGPAGKIQLRVLRGLEDVASHRRTVEAEIESTAPRAIASHKLRGNSTATAGS
jgi:hypothetical protein